MPWLSSVCAGSPELPPAPPAQPCSPATHSSPQRSTFLCPLGGKIQFSILAGKKSWLRNEGSWPVPTRGTTTGMGRERGLRERDGSHKRSRNHSWKLRERTPLFSKAGTLCQKGTFSGYCVRSSKPANCVRILPEICMFLTEKTKTDVAHIETILRWHVNLRKNYSKPLRFDETSSADIGWLNLNSSFRKRTWTSWGKKCSKFHRYKECTTKWVTHFVEQTCSTDYHTVFRCAEAGQISGFDPLPRKIRCRSARKKA